MAEDFNFLTEQEEARKRLKESINTISKQVDVYAKMQKDPLKILGGASAVGAVLGLVAGSQVRRTKKVYVDAGSPVKHQKALLKIQAQQSRSVGKTLAITLGTMAFKTLLDQVITPRLEEVANSLLEKAGQGMPKAATNLGGHGVNTPQAKPPVTGAQGSVINPDDRKNPNLK